MSFLTAALLRCWTGAPVPTWRPMGPPMLYFCLFLLLPTSGAVGRGRAAQVVPTLTTTSSKTSTRTPQRTISSRASFPWLKTPTALNSETAAYTIDATPSGAPSECVFKEALRSSFLPRPPPLRPLPPFA